MAICMAAVRPWLAPHGHAVTAARTLDPCLTSAGGANEGVWFIIVSDMPSCGELVGSSHALLHPLSS